MMVASLNCTRREKNQLDDSERNWTHLLSASLVRSVLPSVASEHDQRRDHVSASLPEFIIVLMRTSKSYHLTNEDERG